MSRLIILVALAALLAGSTVAQTCSTEWASPVDGSWSDDAKWTNGAPGAGAGGLAPCITAAGAYTVVFDVGAFDSRTVSTLVLGGASGTQTLTLFSGLVLTDAAIRPNGLLDAVGTTGATQGLYATGTVTLEGVVEQGSGTSFLASGGTLDIAPGGVLRLSGPSGAGHASGLFRVRGTIEGVGCPVPNTGECAINAPVEVLGGTLRAVDGVLRTSHGGMVDGATFDAGPTGFLLLNADSAPSRRFVVEGLIQGTPQGSVQWTGGSVAAGPAGATLAVGGTGTQLTGSVILTSAGGSFTNTGLLLKAATGSNFSGISNGIVRNQGVIEIPASLALYAGSRLINEPGGVVRATASGRLNGDGNGSGRFENAGLFVLDAPGGSFSFGDGGFGRFTGPFSRPGSEIRVLAGTLDLDGGPGSRILPDGATLTGTGAIVFPATFQPEGTVSPGTEAQPLARLAHGQFYYPSQVAGSPRLVIDVDADGRSDTLDVSAFGAGGSTSVAILAGALVVRVRPGYVPAVGDVFTILTALTPVTGQFASVVALGAPSGIAFVSELSADQTTVLLRAVAVAPGGPITVSTAAPIGGGVRPIFLSGPGVVGVTAARLECTECLDPTGFGTIQGELSGGESLKESRFDLTSPRAFGLYDLVVSRPGLVDDRMPVTVRPYVSYVRAYPTISRGIGVRPASTGQYNWSSYSVRAATNMDEPGFTLGAAGPEDPALVSFAIATGNPFGLGEAVFYESVMAADPGAPALVFARLPRATDVQLTYGLRVDPSDVLFPEQTPTGPADPRLPFGGSRLFGFTGVQHASFSRTRATVDAALRAADFAPLASYLASVDAADAVAVRVGIGDALQSAPRYVGGMNTLLASVLDRLGASVPVPPGLAVAAAPAFSMAVDAAAAGFFAAVEQAYRIDLAAAPPSVQALLAAEYDALAAPHVPTRGGPEGGDEPPPGAVCPLPPAFTQPLASQNAFSPRNDAPLANAMCEIQGVFASPGTTPLPPLITVVHETVHVIQRQNSQAAGTPFALVVGSCSGGAGGGTGGGAGGGTSCTPPSAPADPNDKTADTGLLCEYGTVTVGGERQTRCVRSFVPLAALGDPVQYTIQFENLPQATANAEFVTITDTLDVALNPATLAVYATSSDSTFSYSVAGQVVTFRFVGIDLPPNVTAPEGQGFLTFGVRPQPGLPPGTEIRNRAHIVFDFNPAIATPVVLHEVRAVADVSAVVAAPTSVEIGTPVAFDVVVANTQGDPAGDVAVTIGTGDLAVASVTTTAGTCTGAWPVVCTFGTLDAATFERVTVSLATPPIGQFTISASTATTAFDGFAANNSDMTEVSITPVGDEAGPDNLLEVTLAAPRPNPARGATTIRWGLPVAGRADVRVFDLLGREVARLVDDSPADAGWHETQWDAAVASGVYVVRLVSGSEVRTRRLVVVR